MPRGVALYEGEIFNVLRHKKKQSTNATVYSGIKSDYSHV